MRECYESYVSAIPKYVFCVIQHFMMYTTIDTIVSQGTFSVGISWDYYRDRGDGLFVVKKYETLREEILNYKHVNVDEYNEEILLKAETYHKTKLVQSMKSNKAYDIDGISDAEVISKDRLICIILYTDYTTLSTHFASTFRKTTVFEPIQATKRRHRNYYWLSKLLQQTVKIYGDWSYDGGSLHGSFFCGMSMVMRMPQFVISMLSPTSTSCQIVVAMKFSGDAGIVIEFNNERGDARYLRGLDVSWISRYKEEDERYCNKYHVGLLFYFLCAQIHTDCFLEMVMIIHRRNH